MLDKKRKMCYIVNMNDEAESRKRLRLRVHSVENIQEYERVSTRPLADKISRPGGGDSTAAKKMKTVYGKINSDLYKMEIHNHAILAQKVDSFPNGAQWEAPADYIYGQLPSSAILQVLRCSEVLFSEKDLGKIKNSEQVKGLITSEIINTRWHGTCAKRVKFNFEKFDELFVRPCRILFNSRSIVVQNDSAIALYDVFG